MKNEYILKINQKEKIFKILNCILIALNRLNMNIKKLDHQKWLQKLSMSQGCLDFIRCMHWLNNNKLSIQNNVVANQLLIFVEKGCIQACLNGEEHQLSEGTLVWIPPGATRQFQCNRQFRQLNNFRLHFSLSDSQSQLCFTRKAQVLKNCWELQPFFQMLHKAYRKPYQYNFEYVKGTLMGLSARFIYLLSQQAENKRGLSEQQQQIISQYSQEHITERIKPKVLAKLTRFTPDYFSRMFRYTYGEAPRIYLMKERIRYGANQLLESNLSIKDLAFTLGYVDENLFCRQFRKVMKCSPKQYRQLYGL